MKTEFQPAVLMFNIEEGVRKDKIVRYLDSQGIRAREVLTSDYLQPLGYLVEMPGFERNDAVNLDRNFTDEMLIMFGFDKQMLDAFLAFFKEEKAESVALKAMVTPTNINWNPADLHDEIAKEHAYMTARDKR